MIGKVVVVLDLDTRKSDIYICAGPYVLPVHSLRLLSSVSREGRQDTRLMKQSGSRHLLGCRSGLQSDAVCRAN